jgi:hypothetical protein
MTGYIEFKPITAEKPKYDIKHAGNIPGVCHECNHPAVEFLVFANQHLAFVRFYCHEHYLAEVYKVHPNGFPSEPM